MPIGYAGGQLYLQFRYHPRTVEKVRALPDRTWDKDQKVWWVPLEFLPAVEEMLPDLHVTEEARAAYERHYRSLDASRATDTDRINPNLPGGEMRPYQAAGVRYMEGKAGRVLLADQPGLGKSVQSLAFVYRKPERQPAVVVCPAMVKEHWRQEAVKWLGWSWDSIEVLYGTKPSLLKPRALYVLNYEILHNWKSYLQQTGFQTLIIDESQAVKNPGAKKSLAVEHLAEGIPHVLCLTGTPVMNRPEELWNQVKMIRPDMFPSRRRFLYRYQGDESNRVSREALEELEERLRFQLMLRRTKDQVLQELPELQRVTLPMGVNLKTYEKARREAVARLEAFRGSSSLSGYALGEIVELRKETARVKVPPIIEWVEDFIDSERALIIYAHHHEILDRLGRELDAPVMDGRVPSKKRSALVSSFQEGEIPLMVCGIRSMGVGINLFRAQYCLMTELDWHMAAHYQAESRLHRYGQKGAVTSYYAVALGTIDEPMMAMLDTKAEVTETILGDDNPDPKVLDGLLKSLIPEE